MFPSAARPNTLTEVVVMDGDNLVAPADVTITWNPPDNANDFDFDLYEINLMPIRRSNFTSDTQITFYQLPSGDYNVSVMAVSRCGTSGQSAATVFSVGKYLL